MSEHSHAIGGRSLTLPPGRDDHVLARDFVPISDSLEWRLGSRYLARRGHAAFLEALVPVPYAVNNQGDLSARAAELLFASLAADPPEGDAPVVVVELGVGLGLFAAYFLDHFRRLCGDRGEDWYARLTYVLGDSSQKMLTDVARRGVLSGHPGRYRLRVVDALDPAAWLSGAAVPELAAAGGPRAVYLNYLLDCLPATVLRSRDGRLEELRVRSRLSRNAPLGEYTDASPADIAALACSPAGREELLDLFPLLAAEYRYEPADPAGVPLPEAAAAEAGRHSPSPALHSHGAIACLEGLLGLLHPRGFVLAGDYGHRDADTADEFAHQRYTGGVFVPVNFGQLTRHFAGAGTADVVAPHAEDGALITRLIGREVPEAVRERFRDLFDKGHGEWLAEPANKARQAAQAMYHEAALAHYQAALERQPSNWLLAVEVVNFLNFGLREPAAGLALAHRAVALNPACSADLWNATGDCYFSLGRVRESRSCFARALRVNPSDAAAHYNLAWVYLHYRDHAEALASLARALSCDRTGQWRERILQKQAEVLAAQDRKSRFEMLANANRVKPPPPLPSAPPKAAAAEPAAPKPPSTGDQPPPDQMRP